MNTRELEYTKAKLKLFTMALQYDIEDKIFDNKSFLRLAIECNNLNRIIGNEKYKKDKDAKNAIDVCKEYMDKKYA